jgi:N-acyl-L-homoserine lactone synthetase
VRIERLSDEKELVRLFAFRYEVFVEELGWMARKDRGAHILVDEFDQESANYAAYDDEDVIVGSLRVVPDSALGLPLERCRVLNGYRGNRRLVELSRLAVAPEWRGMVLAALLMKAGYQCAVRMGATHIVLDTYVGNCQRTERLYEKMGFEQLTEPYDDPDYLWRQGVVTFGLDCGQARREWPTQRPGLFAFFTAEDECIDHGLRPAWSAEPARARRERPHVGRRALPQLSRSRVIRAASVGRDE